MALRLLSVWVVILWAAVSMIIVAMVTIYEQLRRLVLLLMALAFRRRPFRFLVTVICFNLPLALLVFDRTLAVERARFAVCTRVVEILSRRISDSTRVKAFNMLPCVTIIAVDCCSIVLVPFANTLDGVILNSRLG
jgi:hypothetical protein